MSTVLETLLETRKAAAQGLETRRTTLMDELSGLVYEEDGTTARTLTQDEETRSVAILAEVDQVDAEIKEATKAVEKRIKQERKRAKKEARLAEARKDIASAVTDASVTKEPMIYGVDEDGNEAPNSFYHDLARRALSQFTGNDGGAAQRLAEHAHQMEVNVAEGNKIGKAAEIQLRELNREFGETSVERRLKEVRERGRVALDAKTADLEMRTAGTTLTGGGATASASGGGGAAFVTPIFYVKQYAQYRELGRPFADQLNKQTLPDYGMVVYIPAVENPVEVATQQTGSSNEGTGVEESQTKFGYLSANLSTMAGEQFLSQQFLDRAGPNFAADKMVFDQLEIDYGKKIDLATLEAALTSATENTWTGESGTFKLFAKGAAGGFVGQVAKAKGEMRTLAGTILNPSHLFLPQARWEYMASITDENGRPLINPSYGGPWNSLAAGSSDGDEGIEGDTGYKLAGLPVFQDGSIPLHGGTLKQEQAILGCLKEVWFFEGPPVTRVLPQTKGTELLALLQRYSYYTVIKRYAKAITVITGEGLSEVGSNSKQKYTN